MLKRKLFLLFIPLFLIGCSVTDKEISDVKLSVEPIDKNGLPELISNRNRKVLLLNVWATWCAPCREEFPDLVQLAEKYKNKNVEIVGISADYPDEVDSKIIPFLKSQNVNFKNYVQNFSDDSGLINQLNSKWNGALPTTFIYDKTGRQITFLEGKCSFEEFEQEIEKIRN